MDELLRLPAVSARTQGKRYMCGGNFTGSLRRSDFGMQFMIPAVGDEVKLWIGIEAFRN